MTRIHPQLLGVALLALASGCVPDFDTDLSRLSAPRLLAISSSPAEARAETEITLTALVATPEGQQAPRLDWSMCLARKPLTELGPVNPVCLEPDDGTGQVQALGAGFSVTARLDREICKLFGPLRPAPMGSDATGRPVDPDVTGGFYQPFAATLDGVVSLGAVRIDCDLPTLGLDETIAYRARYRLNENPVIARVEQVSGSELEALAEDETTVVRAGHRLQLRASWNDCSSESTCGDGLCTAGEDRESCAEDCSAAQRGCTGAEPYVWVNQDNRRIEPRREGVTVAWYASRGHFEVEQTGLDEEQAASVSFTENTYVASNEPGPATVWLVIRDTRGGQSWQIRHLEVTP
jgi:hypothetical protein